MRTTIAAITVLAVSLVPVVCYADSVTNTVTNTVGTVTTDATDGVKAVTSEVSDTAITTQVKAALAAKPGVSSMAIGVTTENGVVHLDGKIKSAGQAKDAVETAKKVYGVKSVDASKLIVGQ